MDWANLLKLVHVVLGFALVAGLFGRWSLERRAREAKDLETAATLSRAAAPFERLVLAAGPGIILAGLATAAAKGYPFLGLTTGWLLVSLVLVLTFPFVLAPLVYIPGTRRIEAALATAREHGRWTEDLATAYANPALRLARWYEGIVTTAVIALMVLKPF